MEERSIETMSLDGGWPCLDFINTVHDRTVENPFEYLPDYQKWLEWALKVKIIDAGELKNLAANAEKNLKQAVQVHQDVIESREVLYELFLAIAQDKTPSLKTQSRFNQLLSDTLEQLELEFANSVEVFTEWKDKNSLSYPLHIIIKSAYDLLISDMTDRVKECGACGWLFLDQSKNKSRKWCSMETCGSNVKAKRYYHKHKNK